MQVFQAHADKNPFPVKPELGCYAVKVDPSLEHPYHLRLK